MLRDHPPGGYLGQTDVEPRIKRPQRAIPLSRSTLDGSIFQINRSFAHIGPLSAAVSDDLHVALSEDMLTTVLEQRTHWITR